MQHNTPLQDIATALTGSIARSGAGGMLGDLNLNGFKATNLSDGTNPGDAATIGQIAPVAGEIADERIEEAIGSTVQGYDPEILKADTDDNLTAGFTATAVNDGTKSSGTYTPTPVGGNYRRIVNGGAFTLAAPSAPGDYDLTIQVTNNNAAGAITASGFSRVDFRELTTTDGDDFFLSIKKVNGFTAVLALALQ